MTLRHAAALALVGWYLMVPPYNDNFVIDSRAPLSQWQVFMPYDDAATCEAVLTDRVRVATTVLNHPERYTHDYRPGTADRFITQQRQFEFAQCIASDDPRRKEK